MSFYLLHRTTTDNDVEREKRRSREKKTHSPIPLCCCHHHRCHRCRLLPCASFRDREHKISEHKYENFKNYSFQQCMAIHFTLAREEKKKQMMDGNDGRAEKKKWWWKKRTVCSYSSIFFLMPTHSLPHLKFVIYKWTFPWLAKSLFADNKPSTHARTHIHVYT